MNLFSMLDCCIAEVLVALAFPATSSVLGLTMLEVAQRGGENVDAYLPRSLAARFMSRDSANPPKRVPGDQKEMWGTLRDAMEVARRVMEMNSSPLIQARVKLIMWTVFVNILAHIDPDIFVSASSHVGPAKKGFRSQWSAEWLNDVHRIGSFAVVPDGGGLAFLQEGGPLLLMRPSHLCRHLELGGDGLVRVHGIAAGNVPTVLTVDLKPDLAALDASVVGTAALSCAAGSTETAKTSDATSDSSSAAVMMGHRATLDPLASEFSPWEVSAEAEVDGKDKDDEVANAAAREEAEEEERRRAVQVLWGVLLRSMVAKLISDGGEEDGGESAREDGGTWQGAAGGQPAVPPPIQRMLQPPMAQCTLQYGDPYGRKWRYDMYQLIPCHASGLMLIVNVEVCDKFHNPYVLSRSDHPR